MRSSFSAWQPRTLSIGRYAAQGVARPIPLKRRWWFSGNEWTWNWIDGREFRYRLPPEGETTGWRLSCDDQTVWTAEIHQHFLWWKAKGLVWSCIVEPNLNMLRRRRRLSRPVTTIETDAGWVIGAYMHDCRKVEGVIRSSVASDLGPIVVAAALGGVVS